MDAGEEKQRPHALIEARALPPECLQGRAFGQQCLGGRPLADAFDGAVALGRVGGGDNRDECAHEAPG